MKKSLLLCLLLLAGSLHGADQPAAPVAPVAPALSADQAKAYALSYRTQLAQVMQAAADLQAQVSMLTAEVDALNRELAAAQVASAQAKTPPHKIKK